jgi:hypothetical protein
VPAADSADIDSNAAVAAARQTAQLGLPAVASCLATPSPAAAMRPAVEATLQLLQRVVRCLHHTQHSSWPAAANMPRAHFPFPVGPELNAAQHSVAATCINLCQPRPLQLAAADSRAQVTVLRQQAAAPCAASNANFCTNKQQQRAQQHFAPPQCLCGGLSYSACRRLGVGHLARSCHFLSKPPAAAQAGTPMTAGYVRLSTRATELYTFAPCDMQQPL